MTADRWLEVESVAAAALEQPADRRIAFLDQTCGADSALRSEVESLLAYEGAAERFLPRPALEEAARMFADHSVSESAEWHIPGYQIAELLGAGGMGEVYRARDQRLDRDVAIKVFPLVAGYEQTTVRFEEEARAASALNHPNIVTIYAVGNQDDLAYIVMELVSGRRLRDLLAGGPLPQGRVLDIAVQLAEGLAAAHDAGIVHRDLKPENVMVTAEGLVKILDFGIAKRRGVGPAAIQPLPVPRDGATRHTRVVGTVGYMAPEQAAGAPVDYRADQFSFGAMLEELTRDGPATGSLANVIERCLKERPEERYGRTRDLASALRDIRDQALRDLHRSGVDRRRAIWLGAAGLVTAATAIGTVRWLPRATAPRRLAVLRFANALDDNSSQYLCDGITEVLIRQLARIPAITVMSPDTVFRLQRTGDPREIGRQLSVDQVLIGSVARRAGRAAVQIRLVDTKTGNLIWEDEFTRGEGDVLGIQGDIAAAIMTAGLGLTLTEVDNLQLRRALTADPEAYRLFLQGIHHFRLDTESDYKNARRLLLQAIDRDPKFALALLTLGSTFSVMAVDGYAKPDEAWSQSHLYVTRALDQDPALPDAHGERAVEAFLYKRDWALAQQEWQAALNSPRGELQPEFLTAYAMYLWAIGRAADAIRFAHDARTADPLSTMLAVKEADLLAGTDQHDAAATLYMKVIQNDPKDTRAYFGLAEVRRAQRRFDEAIDLWRRAYAAAEDHSLDSEFEQARGVEGCNDLRHTLARRELEGLTARRQSGAYASPLDIARAYAQLGENDEVFRHLEMAFEDTSPGLAFLNVERVWDNVRLDPRFREMVKRVGLA